MTPYKEYPWGYIGHYSELNEWFIHHYNSQIQLGTFSSLLEAEIMLTQIEIDYQVDELGLENYVTGYTVGYHSALRGDKFEPYTEIKNDANCTNL